jgi:cobalamin biosynthesis Mg chelatase CobN
MAHILPTGRNFYAVDPQAIPSQAAWRVGGQLADELIARYQAEEQAYPESVGLSIWGTSAMRTHGDDIAQCLALLGSARSGRSKAGGWWMWRSSRWPSWAGPGLTYSCALAAFSGMPFRS